jgi:hypothetical protein
VAGDRAHRSTVCEEPPAKPATVSYHAQAHCAAAARPAVKRRASGLVPVESGGVGRDGAAFRATPARRASRASCRSGFARSAAAAEPEARTGRQPVGAEPGAALERGVSRKPGGASGTDLGLRVESSAIVSMRGRLAPANRPRLRRARQPRHQSGGAGSARRIRRQQPSSTWAVSPHLAPSA